jgi:hypothetical protein
MQEQRLRSHRQSSHVHRTDSSPRMSSGSVATIVLAAVHAALVIILELVLTTRLLSKRE